jgi:hypothetical protein
MQPQVAGSCALDAPYRPLAVPRTAVAIRLPKLWLAQCRCGAHSDRTEHGDETTAKRHKSTHHVRFSLKSLAPALWPPHTDPWPCPEPPSLSGCQSCGWRSAAASRLSLAPVCGAGGPGPSRGRCCSGSGCKGATTCNPLRLVAASSRDSSDCNPLRPRARRGRVLRAAACESARPSSF